MIDQKPFQQVQEAREKRTKKSIGKTAALTIARPEQRAGRLEALQTTSESPLRDVPTTSPADEGHMPRAILSSRHHGE